MRTYYAITLFGHMYSAIHIWKRDMIQKKSNPHIVIFIYYYSFMCLHANSDEVVRWLHSNSELSLGKASMS